MSVPLLAGGPVLLTRQQLGGWASSRTAGAVPLMALMAVLATSLGVAGAGRQAGGAAATSEPLPSARAVFDRHLTAIGGRAALLSHSSTTARGTMSIPAAGVTGPFEAHGAVPNKSISTVTLGGVGEIVDAFDGTHGWTTSPLTGPMVFEGAALEDKRFDADYRAELKSEGRYASTVVLERSLFDGRPCYKVRLVRKIGGEDLEFYDVATGLKAGSIMTRESAMGAVQMTSVETNYRAFGKLLHATLLRIETTGVEQVITIDSIAFDSVPSSAFEMPAGIKALIK